MNYKKETHMELIDMMEKIVKFKVAESTVKEGITAPEAFLKYGKKMLTLSEAYPLFGNEEKWKQNKGILVEGHSVWTSTFIGFSKKPLCETIRKDSDGYFLKSSSYGISEKLYLTDDFFSKNENKSGIVIVEKGVSIDKLGDNNYAYRVSDANDLRLISVHSENWTNTSNHPSLFGSIENLRVYLKLPDADVKVGFATAGGYIYYAGVRTIVFVPDLSYSHHRVLIRDE